MSTQFFLLSSFHNDDTPRSSHVFIYVPQADEMKWTCVYVCKRNESAIILHTYMRAFILLDVQSQNKEKQQFFLPLSLFLFRSLSLSLLFSLVLILVSFLFLLVSYLFDHQSCQCGVHITHYYSFSSFSSLMLVEFYQEMITIIKFWKLMLVKISQCLAYLMKIKFNR